MPKALHWLTTACFVFALFIPLALIPGGSHYINGVPVTAADFWRRGGGAAFVFAGILFPICGYGFLRAKNWSRYLFVTLLITMSILSLLVGGISWSATPYVLLVALAVYYFFWRPNVREYFGAVDRAPI